MRIKGSLDAVHVGPDEARTMRAAGEYVPEGWHAIDDNLKRHLGPHPTKEACDRAIALAQGETPGTDLS